MGFSGFVESQWVYNVYRWRMSRMGVVLSQYNISVFVLYQVLQARSRQGQTDYIGAKSASHGTLFLRGTVRHYGETDIQISNGVRPIAASWG